MKVRLTLSKKKILLLASILLLFLLALTLFQRIKLPVYSWNYYGKNLKFRINLRDAEKVPIYPSEIAVRKEILNSFVENITIVFKPGNETINAHYAVEVFEITYKLTLAYKLNFAYIPNFNVVNITSYENLKGTRENPIIALVHPIYSNETSVKLENHVIYIKGENAKSSVEQLRNFDLAVTKFLMAALEIKI
ncbi:MAG: hypothetical protein QXR09_03710 [Candidatus Aenigmatarchaeota archaeon]